MTNPRHQFTALFIRSPIETMKLRGTWHGDQIAFLWAQGSDTSSRGDRPVSGCWECERAVIVLGPDSKLHFECELVSSNLPSCPAFASNDVEAVEGVLRPSDTGLFRSAQCGDEPVMSKGDDDFYAATFPDRKVTAVHKAPPISERCEIQLDRFRSGAPGPRHGDCLDDQPEEALENTDKSRTKAKSARTLALVNPCCTT